jgi:uncharacterized protein (TIGR03437 family)
VIVLFATTGPYPAPDLPVNVTIGGLPAATQYVGGPPGLIAGLLQINAVIPAGVQTGNTVPVALQAGNVSGQTGVTIAVR